VRPAWELPQATVPPFAARWFLLRMRSGPVTAELVRREALALRQNGRSGHAAQLDMAWAQLKMSARAWDDEHDDGPVATSAAGSDGAEVGDSVAPSASGSEITAKEAAMRLGITREAVGQRLRSGALMGRKVGSAWLVDRASVELSARTRRAS
jgi:hypothetical protein